MRITSVPYNIESSVVGSALVLAADIRAMRIQTKCIRILLRENASRACGRKRHRSEDLLDVVGDMP